MDEHPRSFLLFSWKKLFGFFSGQNCVKGSVHFVYKTTDSHSHKKKGQSRHRDLLESVCSLRKAHLIHYQARYAYAYQRPCLWVRHQPRVGAPCPPSPLSYNLTSCVPAVTPSHDCFWMSVQLCHSEKRGITS